MATYQAEAVVLRARDLGEADKLLTLFARGHGKIRAVARGARRTKSRLLAGTQLFARIQASLWVGRNLDGISQCQVLESNRACREDLVSLGCASYAAEIVDLMARERDPNDAAYQGLEQGLSVLCRISEARYREGRGSPSFGRGAERYVVPYGVARDPASTPANPSEVAALWMAVTFLRAFGYAPEMRRCVACGEPIGRLRVREALPVGAASPKSGVAHDIRNAKCPAGFPHARVAFDPALGGLVCARCLRAGSSIAVSPAAVEAFVALSASGSPEAALRERVSSEAARGVADIVERHLTFHVEHRLKSSAFFRSVVEEESLGHERGIRPAGQSN